MKLDLELAIQQFRLQGPAVNHHLSQQRVLLLLLLPLPPNNFAGTKLLHADLHTNPLHILCSSMFLLPSNLRIRAAHHLHGNPNVLPLSAAAAHLQESVAFVLTQLALDGRR